MSCRAQDIHINSVKTTDADGWGDIGFMYKAENATDYMRGSTVTVDFEKCTFAKGLIYSERPITGSHDGNADKVFMAAAQRWVLKPSSKDGNGTSLCFPITLGNSRKIPDHMTQKTPIPLAGTGVFCIAIGDHATVSVGMRNDLLPRAQKGGKGKQCFLVFL